MSLVDRAVGRIVQIQKWNSRHYHNRPETHYCVETLQGGREWYFSRQYEDYCDDGSLCTFWSCIFQTDEDRAKAQLGTWLYLETFHAPGDYGVRVEATIVDEVVEEFLRKDGDEPTT